MKPGNPINANILLAYALGTAMGTGCLDDPGVEPTIEARDGAVGRTSLRTIDQTGTPGSDFQTTPIRGGTVGFHAGVVAIGACTGTMISSRLIITAAHCLPAAEGATGGSWSWTIAYFDPKTQSTHNVWLTDDNDLIFERHPDFDPHNRDEADDFGYVYNPHDDGWKDTDFSDYLRIDRGMISSPSHTVWGVGHSDNNGGGSGILRYLSMAVTAVESTHYVYTSTLLAGICRGDSGGPALDVNDGTNVVSGVGCCGQVDSLTDKCINGKTWYTATAPKLTWLLTDSGVGTSSCDYFDRAGASYARCFKIPFINSVANEDLERGMATAIAVAIL